LKGFASKDVLKGGPTMLFKIVAVTACVCALAPAALIPGWNEVRIRDVAQDVLRIPAHSPRQSASVLFLPGDGGWRGAAKDIAQAIAGSGYEVYVWDTKRYLASFTRGKSTLREEQIASDFAAMRVALGSTTNERFVLLGWSQGAAMSVVAGASQEGKNAFAGVIALALPDAGVLGWRWRDNLCYLTGGTPKEPTFRTEPYLSRLAPLPTAVIQAGRDKFTPQAVSRRLLSHLRHPRRIRTLEEAEHDFDPERNRLFDQLRQSLDWITGHPADTSGAADGAKTCHE
jgi:pimeloyl-ACP methyl ester carboxylesterase